MIMHKTGLKLEANVPLWHYCELFGRCWKTARNAVFQERTPRVDY